MLHHEENINQLIIVRKRLEKKYVLRVERRQWRPRVNLRHGEDHVITCDESRSGLTRVGVTRGGNSGCHPYFLWKNWRPFSVIAVWAPIYFLLKYWRPFSLIAVTFTNFTRVSPPWRVSPTFLKRGMECRRGLAMRIPSVRPSVRPSNACIVTKRKKDMFSFLYDTKDNLS